MLTTHNTILYLIAFAAMFAAAGVWYARRSRDDLEDFLVARNSQSATATVFTLLASSLGAWILFAPAQAASWGGLAAVLGYALGSMAPRIVMMPLGKRMRQVLPRGHTLTEFVMARYGHAMHALILLIMLFYLFITLTAEITAMAKIITLIAPVPLWVSAAVVLASTLVYTSLGGLKASIFTDKIQMLIIVPLLCVLTYMGWRASGGVVEVTAQLQSVAPQLLQIDDATGLKAGLTFLVAILLTGLFHQGNWQRVYAARSIGVMRRGFLLGGVLVAPVVFVTGLFGLVFMAQGGGLDSSVALFQVIIPSMPLWFVIALIPLGLALVMSSADTAISAVSSLAALGARRFMPQLGARELMRIARLAIYVLSLPVLLAAAQGYSVLYLFLLADLFCSAAAFPVFYGLYSNAYSGRMALISTLAGLAAGLYWFPRQGEDMQFLLESFLLAALVPVLVSAVLKLVWRTKPFDLGQLQDSVRGLSEHEV